MAIDTAPYPSTLDRSAYQYVDDYLSIWEAMALPMNRLMLLDWIPTGESLKERTYYWTQDLTSNRTVTLAEEIDNSSETTWTLTTGHELRVQKGDLLHAYHANLTEWVQIVDDPNTSAHTIATANIPKLIDFIGKSLINNMPVFISGLMNSESEFRCHRNSFICASCIKHYDFASLLKITLKRVC